MKDPMKDTPEYCQGFLEGYSQGIRDGYRDLRKSIEIDLLSGDFEPSDYIDAED